MTTDNKDPRLADESKLQEIRRRVEEVAADAPHLAKIALEAMIRKHNPDLKGSARSAGRAGKQSGNVSELTAIATLKPGDLIWTGTPTGAGVHRNPPVWLKPGDVAVREVAVEQVAGRVGVKP